MRQPLSLNTRLIEKRRGLARTLLYSAPLLLLCLWWWIANSSINRFAASAWIGQDYSEDSRLKIFQQYLRIDSSFPDGSEIPAAEFLARQLESAGIDSTIERIGTRNANLWALLEGEDPAALVLLNHLDVEPVRFPDKWLHPAFSGHYEAPFVYGRGAFDMKSYTIAQLTAFIEAAQADQPPHRSLMFLATGDEERGGTLGVQWWLREHPELVARVSAVLTEGGAVEAINLEEVKYWGTEFHQKRFATFRICSGDRDRLEDLRRVIVGTSTDAYELDEATRLFFAIYSSSRQNPSIRDTLRSIDKNLSSVDIGKLPDYHRSMVGNTVEVLPVAADPEGGWVLEAAASLLTGAKIADVWDGRFEALLAGYQYSLEAPIDSAPHSSLDHWLYKAVDNAISSRLPGVEHGPLILSWSATDSRFFRRLGIPSFGFTPFWILSSDAARMRGINERIPVPAFLAGVELYSDLVQELIAD